MAGRFATLFAALFVSTSAFAEAPSEARRIYAHAGWEVAVMSFEDATLSCRAEVRAGVQSFSVWADGIHPVRLQFHNPSWNFGTARDDLVVQVDQRPPWTLYDAELFEQSVFFGLNSSDPNLRFLVEIKRGTRMTLVFPGRWLRAEWSLAGSARAIDALVQCVDLLLNAPA